MHFELLSFSATAPGAGGASAAAFVGDSLTIKNGQGKCRILQWWTDQQADGWQQVVFPSAHDTTRGYRAAVEIAEVKQLLPLGVEMEVHPQELLSITISGSAVGGDVETGCMLVQYDSLPGVTQRGITWSQLLSRTEMLTTLQGSLAAGAGPGYSGAELITADSDLLRANRDYAVIGIKVTTQCAAISVRGPDTGYVRCGVPGDVLNPDIGANYFATLARSLDRPLIPVINSGNKASTFLDVAQDENAAAVPFTVFLALLK